MTPTTPNKDDFYIGYEDKVPLSYNRFTKKLVVFIFLILGLIAFIIVKSQKGFSTATYELGKKTEILGFLTTYPVPMLTTLDGSESTLLVGFGKFGADKTLATFLKVGPFDVLKATVSGTLIYHDGKSLLELTDGEKSIISNEPFDGMVTTVPIGAVTLQGEIIDPKCYFGAMKPGEGKTHRACAIRCVSGGIPPVLKVENELGETNYFILLGQNGEAINDRVLDYIAEPVIVKGSLEQFNNWMILYVDDQLGIKRVL